MPHGAQSHPGLRTFHMDETLSAESVPLTTATMSDPLDQSQKDDAEFVEAMREARKAFMARTSVVETQIASFDKFVDSTLPNKIIKEQPFLHWISPCGKFLNVIEFGTYYVGTPHTKGADGVVHDTW